MRRTPEPPGARMTFNHAAAAFTPGTTRHGGTPRHYLIALGVVILTMLICWPLHSILEDRVPYLTLFGAVAFASWIGRWKVGVFAALIGFVAANYFIVPPPFARSEEHTSELQSQSNLVCRLL